MSFDLCNFLKNNKISFSNEDLSKKSHIKIGVIAKTVYPDSEQELIRAVSLFEEFGIPYKILGRMSNVLITDSSIDRVFIKTDRLDAITVDGGGITAECGVRFSNLIRKALGLGFSLLPELVGIPGCVGGMIYSNAGAFGREIADQVISCKVFNKASGDVVLMSKDEMTFGYRNSILRENKLVLLEVRFSLICDLKECIEEKMKAVYEKRKSTQPVGFLSLGSVFKRPEGDFAARLIDASGLKGLRIGDAQISEKHAGFIVNLKSATAEDILSLVEIVKNTVYKKFGVVLEEEIEILR